MSQKPQPLLPLNHPQFPAKLKVLLKMLTKRISLRLKQEEQQAKIAQREVAKLLSELNKEQKAYYKVESMIMDDCTVQMLEILDNYSEMVLVRVPILNSTISTVAELDENESLSRGIRTLLLAALHFPEFKELVQFRELMVLKFGRGFVESTMNASKRGYLESELKKGYLESENETEVAKEEDEIKKSLKEEEEDIIKTLKEEDEINKSLKEEDDIKKPLKACFDSKFLRLCERKVADEAQVEAYLCEIAKAYKVPYSKLPAVEKEVEKNVEEDVIIAGDSEAAVETSAPKLSDLESRFAMLKSRR